MDYGCRGGNLKFNGLGNTSQGIRGYGLMGLGIKGLMDLSIRDRRFID